MVTAIYPGSFDPVTFGHIDIIRRASRTVDELIIGVLVNTSKSTMFTLDERVKLLEEVTKDLPNVIVRKFNGLTVDFAKENGAAVIIRGLRAVSDFESEMQIAQTNKLLYPACDTLFLTTSLEYSYLSSTIVKEVAHFGGDLSKFVPDVVIEALKEKAIDK